MKRSFQKMPIYGLQGGSYTILEAAIFKVISEFVKVIGGEERV